MRRLAIVVLAAAGMSAAALAQEVDVQKAVHCATLSQQFTDSVKTAKAEDDVKKAAADLVKQGDQACMAHDYDAGLDQLRQALQQIGLKPIV
jgi:ABC-type sugar transport system substrate-binding protein